MKIVGWVRIHRKIEENPIWLSEKFTRGQAWVDLLLLTAHKDTYFYVRGIRVDVKRGQIAWSQEKLAKRWKWGRLKVANYLTGLTLQGMLAKKQHDRISIYTVLNYEKHQSDQPQTVRQTVRQTSDKQYIYNNDKNDKNDKKYIYNIYFQKFLEIFNSLYKSEYKPTKKLNELYNLRRKTFTVEEIERALRCMVLIPFYKGRNDTGWKPTPEFILRNDEKVDEFLNQEVKPKAELKYHFENGRAVIENE